MEFAWSFTRDVITINRALLDKFVSAGAPRGTLLLVGRDVIVEDNFTLLLLL